MHYTFNKDVVDGELAEHKLKCHLEMMSIVQDTLPHKTSDRDFTIFLPYVSLTVEVKNDMKSKETGNIGIEYESWGKPSGIAVTKANLWFQFYSDEFWFLSTKKLKTLIDNNVHYRTATGGDKGSFTKMYLFRKEVFEKHASLFVPQKFETWLRELNEKYETKGRMD